jgi:hypothetical protein
MIHSEDLRIPIRMDVGPILWRTNHHELVVVGVDRVPVTTDVIGGVVDGQCLDRIDLIVGDPDRVPLVFSKHLGSSPSKSLPRSRFRRWSLSFDTNPFDGTSARNCVHKNMSVPSSLGLWDPPGQMRQVEGGCFSKPRCGGGVQTESPLDSGLYRKHQRALVELQLRDDGASRSASLHPSYSSSRKSV